MHEADWTKHYIEKWLGSSDLCHLHEIDSGWHFYLTRKLHHSVYFELDSLIVLTSVLCTLCSWRAPKRVMCLNCNFIPFLWEIISLLMALCGSFISVRFKRDRHTQKISLLFVLKGVYLPRWKENNATISCKQARSVSSCAKIKNYSPKWRWR